jgi:hypothetical protein
MTKRKQHVVCILCGGDVRDGQGLFFRYGHVLHGEGPLQALCNGCTINLSDNEIDNLAALIATSIREGQPQ